MKVYKDDSDEFDPEYLAYLATLSFEITCEGEVSRRVTYNSAGEMVRIEEWTREPVGDSTYIYGYRDQHLEGWMK